MSEFDALALRNDIVALFPGQGSITGGAGEVWRTSEHWSVVDEISDASGIDVADLLLNATTDDVVRTDRAQIATFALSMIGFRELSSRNVQPGYVLGHSLGEFSALVASGMIGLGDGARLISIRGRAMARAAQEQAGSMVALMGGDEEAFDRLSTLTGVWVANINGTGQIVVSGTRDGLEDVLSRHKELGWRRATPLPVGGAFHSPLMASAQSELDEALDGVTWAEARVPIIANVDGQVHTSPTEWRELLSRQLTSPVQFLAATLRLPPDVTTTIEMPPGSVLTGLTKRIREFERQIVLSDPQQLKEMAL